MTTCGAKIAPFGIWPDPASVAIQVRGFCHIPRPRCVQFLRPEPGGPSPIGSHPVAGPSRRITSPVNISLSMMCRISAPYSARAAEP